MNFNDVKLRAASVLRPPVLNYECDAFLRIKRPQARRHAISPAGLALGWHCGSHHRDPRGHGAAQAGFGAPAQAEAGPFKLLAVLKQRSRHCRYTRAFAGRPCQVSDLVSSRSGLSTALRWAPWRPKRPVALAVASAPDAARAAAASQGPGPRRRGRSIFGPLGTWIRIGVLRLLASCQVLFRWAALVGACCLP